MRSDSLLFYPAHRDLMPFFWIPSWFHRAASLQKKRRRKRMKKKMRVLSESSAVPSPERAVPLQSSPPAGREEYCCPLTLQLFEDPVVAADGHTYDREAIEQWFDRCHAKGQPYTSPLTNARLDTRTVYPNHTLRMVLP